MPPKKLRGLDEGDKLLTPKEAAEMLNIDADTLSKWWAEGKVPITRIERGRKYVRYRRSEINDWIAVMEQRPKRGKDPVLDQDTSLPPE